MKFGLIGENLQYSLSKYIHNRLYEILRLDFIYENYEITSKELKQTILQEDTCYNVTIPFKSQVIDYLDELSDTAKGLQSVNTVVNDKGKLYGYNTDIIGFELMLQKFGVVFTNQSIVILGTGASARMVKYYALKNNCQSVKLVGIDDGDLTYNDHLSGDIVINTTPVGMKFQSDESLLTVETVNNFHTVIDLNYNPYRTKLLRYGIYCNKKVVSGLYMLVAQAIKSEELFLNRTIDQAVIDLIYNELSNHNIALIGMMGCGKSTVGRVLAEQMGLDFIDLDDYIMEQEKQTIDQLFMHGEAYFRELETMYLKQLSNLSNTVIACGGGVVLNEQNIDTLYQNSTVIYLKRDLSAIISTIDVKNRPLIQENLEKQLESLYKSREKLYTKYSEYCVDNSTVTNAVNEIREWLGR